MLADTLITLLSILTIIADVFIVASIIFVLSGKRIFKGVYKAISSHAHLLAFVVALVASAGSLFFSEIAKYTPCELCWFQRIFMYPQVIILGIGLLTKDRSSRVYSLWLSVIGGLISAYHYTIQRLNIQTSCSIDIGVSCTTIEMFRYGYITIAMMALSAFVVLILLNTLYRKNK